MYACASCKSALWLRVIVVLDVLDIPDILLIYSVPSHSSLTLVLVFPGVWSIYVLPVGGRKADTATWRNFRHLRFC
jgi:hypothetical protein